jgi:hypothetical protein
MLATIRKSAADGDSIRFVLQSGDAVQNGAIARQLTVSYIPLINRLTRDGGVPYLLAVGNHDVGTATDLRDPRRLDGLHDARYPEPGRRNAGERGAPIHCLAGCEGFGG